MTGDCLRPLLQSDHSGLIRPQNAGPEMSRKKTKHQFNFHTSSLLIGVHHKNSITTNANNLASLETRRRCPARWNVIYFYAVSPKSIRNNVFIALPRLFSVPKVKVLTNDLTADCMGYAMVRFSEGRYLFTPPIRFTALSSYRVGIFSFAFAVFFFVHPPLKPPTVTPTIEPRYDKRPSHWIFMYVLCYVIFSAVVCSVLEVGVRVFGEMVGGENDVLRGDIERRDLSSKINLIIVYSSGDI